MARHGLSPGTLVLPERRDAAVALLDDLVAVARHECDVAFEYSLLLPRSEPGLRLFCLWPLLFALRTLGALAHNPAVFEPAPVKIDRETVMRIMVLTRESVTDDPALKALYAECARGLPEGSGGMTAPRTRTAASAVERGLEVLAATQDAGGSWKGDYGGPLFLVPVYVAGLELLGRPPDAGDARRLHHLPPRAPERRTAAGGWTSSRTATSSPRCWST